MLYCCFHDLLWWAGVSLSVTFVSNIVKYIALIISVWGEFSAEIFVVGLFAWY